MKGIFNSSLKQNLKPYPKYEINFNCIYKFVIKSYQYTLDIILASNFFIQPHL